MYLIDDLVNKLINIKLSPKEIEMVIDGLLINNTRCPCRIADRNCDICKYKTIDANREGRIYSGCVDAIVYHTVMTVTDNFKDDWSKILYKALKDALITNYHEQYIKIVKKWDH